MFAFLFVVALGFRPVQGAEKAEPIDVAVSVYNEAPAYMRQWTEDLKNHPAVLDGRVKLHIYGCIGNHLVQHMHFETISSMRYDAVIFVANDWRGSKRMVDIVRESGIPVVASCAPTIADGLEAFIGPDDVKAGFATATAVLDAMGGTGNVVVLRGPSEQGSVQLRNAGIADALKKYPGVTEVRTASAGWSRVGAMEIVQNLLDRNVQIDGIIAQNDEIALGALDVLKRNNASLVPIASIDGIPAAVDAVERGELLQTLRQDSVLEAQGALDLVLRNVVGPEYAPEGKGWDGDLLEQWHDGKQHYDIPWEMIRKNDSFAAR